MTEKEKVYKVIIIGAGIAGLSASNFLQQHGISDILILEAKPKPGGRIQTRTLSCPTEKLELGAQWIHGEENELFKVVKKSGHLHQKTSWEGKGDFLLPDGTKADSESVLEIMDWLENTIGYVEEAYCIEELQSNPSQYSRSAFSSMGKFLKERFRKYLRDSVGISVGSAEYELKTALFQWGMSFQRIDNSCNQMRDLSLFRWSEFQVNPGEHYNNFKDGGSEFVEKVLVRPLPSGMLKCNAPVENVAWGSIVENGLRGGDALAANINVQVRNGHRYLGQIGLITCSIGVLKVHQETLFTPKLPPNLQNAINSTGFGPITKIFLIWSSPWWPRNTEGFQFLWPNQFIDCCDDDYYGREGDISDDNHLRHSWFKSITGFDPVIDFPSALVGWLGGPEAVFVENCIGENEVGEVCAKILKEFTRYEVPLPEKVVVTKWNSDEFVRGAYCYRSTQGDQIHGDIAAALSKPVMYIDSDGNEKPAIILAGEACSKNCYSTIHGAYESGICQAAKIVEFFNNVSNDVVSTAMANNHTNTHVLPNISKAEINGSSKLEGISEIGQLTNLGCQFSQQVNIH